MPKQRKTYSPQEALARLQDLCSRSEKCIYDIRQKLITWNISSTDADNIVTKLLTDKFVDEQRYANAYVREKLNIAKWGVQKIARSLSAKRIPTEVIRTALQELNPQNYESELLNLLKKKKQSIKADSERAYKDKLLRFALSRGYEYELCYRLINGLFRED